MRVFGDTGQATESSDKTKVISVIQTALSRALAKNVRSATFYSVVQEAVHECLAESKSVAAVTTRVIDAPAFTVLVDKLAKHEVEKGSSHKTKMEKRFDKLVEAVD